jgi:hypothetical protein
MLQPDLRRLHADARGAAIRAAAKADANREDVDRDDVDRENVGPAIEAQPLPRATPTEEVREWCRNHVKEPFDDVLIEQVAAVLPSFQAFGRGLPKAYRAMRIRRGVYGAR